MCCRILVWTENFHRRNLSVGRIISQRWRLEDASGVSTQNMYFIIQIHQMLRYRLVVVHHVKLFWFGSFGGGLVADKLYACISSDQRWKKYWYTVCNPSLHQGIKAITDVDYVLATREHTFYQLLYRRLGARWHNSTAKALELRIFALTHQSYVLHSRQRWYIDK